MEISLMNIRSLGLTAVLLAGLSPGALWSQTAHQNTPPQAKGRDLDLRDVSDNLQDLVKRTSPAVVQITSTGFTLSNQDSSDGSNAAVFSRERSTGSGVLLSADGLVMTNNHVVAGARKIRVRLNGLKDKNGMPFGDLEAKVLGTDRLTDLALLKIDVSNVPFLPLADSADLQQGELVMAFGSPLGLENSVSMGVISAAARQIGQDDPRVFIQTDAAVNPGNSGGPLVNARGEVVGINTFILSQSGGNEGIGFAIPSNVVRNIFTQLRKDGHVHRGQIGVFATLITPPLAQGLGLAQQTGVMLEDVIPGGSAAKAGLKIGDIILSISGRPITTIPRFAVSLYRYQIGQAAEIDVLRGTERLKFSVPVTEAENDPQRFADLTTQDNVVAELGVVGLSVDKQLQEMLPDLRIPSGVVVAGKVAGATYAGDDAQTGDVIHTVNKTAIDSVDALKQAIKSVPAGSPVVLQVERKGELEFLVLEQE
jgi:serine protease Do